MKKILLGIPVLNNKEMTRCCLQHIVEKTPLDSENYELTLFILDNGSDEDIAAMLRADFSRCPFPLYYHKNPKNLGVGIAWNQILRFSPLPLPKEDFFYDFYIIANNDAMVGPGWLEAMLSAMDVNPRIGWVAALENGSPLLAELTEAHTLSKQYRIAPDKPFTTERIQKSIDDIYAQWGGHDAFCGMVANKKLPAFVPFKGEGRSAVFFMVRPAMINQIGYFDEDYWPIGIAEDLEYFLRMEQLLRPVWLTEERYPPGEKWLAGFAGGAVVHHNWCSTRQGKNFDGRHWDKMREKYWKKKFKKSKKHFTKLFP